MLNVVLMDCKRWGEGGDSFIWPEQGVPRIIGVLFGMEPKLDGSGILLCLKELLHFTVILNILSGRCLLNDRYALSRLFSSE